jgi:hypothetical protein
MDESTRRIMWATAGAALFGSGFAVTASMATSHPVSLWIIAPIVLVVLGIYVFLAALTDSRWLLYPGKIEALRKSRQRTGMARALTFYVSVGDTLVQNDPDNNSWLVTPWKWGAAKLVEAGWGSHQVLLLGLDERQSPRRQVETITDNLRSLIQRTNGIPSEHFTWDLHSDWCTYLTSQFPLSMPDLNRRMTEGA